MVTKPTVRIPDGKGGTMVVNADDPRATAVPEPTAKWEAPTPAPKKRGRPKKGK